MNISSAEAIATPPSVDAVTNNRVALGRFIWETPVLQWQTDPINGDELLDLWLKLEAFQVTGSFKPRGALSVIRSFSRSERGLGLVTVSSGNHAIAVAYGARVFECPARIYMAHNSDSYRVDRARALGADVRLVQDSVVAFAKARSDVEHEGCAFVHPFDGPFTTLGTASIALELDKQLPSHVDTFVIAIGGGSLASGIAPTIKALRPTARVIGVEPTGAATLSKSLAMGRPAQLEVVQTIADSLAPPFAEAYSFGLVRDFVDNIVLVDDSDILAAMRTLFESLKLAVEPAAATALAAIIKYPALFTGRGVCAMVCGSNIGLDRYHHLMKEARALDDPSSVR